MYFKNLLAYRITEDIDFSNLAEALKSKQAKPCTYQEMSTYGFIAPFGKNEQAPLTHVVQDYYLVATCKEERMLPATVVKKELQDKVAKIEKTEVRKVYKKEKDQLKDDIVQALLPRSFTREKITYAAIVPKHNLILIDTSSASKAETLLSALRDVLGSLPIRPISVKQSISATLTDWLRKQQASHGFNILEDCELHDTFDNGGIVKVKRQDLTTEEIKLHLDSGKVVTQLALDYQNKLSFIINDKLVIKRIRFSDKVLEQADKDGGEDAASQFSASFLLMISELTEMLPNLLSALGGEERPQVEK